MFYAHFVKIAHFGDTPVDVKDEVYVVESGENMNWQQIAMLSALCSIASIAFTQVTQNKEVIFVKHIGAEVILPKIDDSLSDKGANNIADDANELQQTEIRKSLVQQSFTLFPIVNATTSILNDEVIGIAPFTLNAEIPESVEKNLTIDWDFGDGNSAIGQRVEHLYKEAGEYKLIVKASDSFLDDKYLINVIVLDPSAVNFEVVDVPFAISEDMAKDADRLESDYDIHFLNGETEGYLQIRQSLKDGTTIEEATLFNISEGYIAQDVLIPGGKREFVFSHANTIRATLLLSLGSISILDKDEILEQVLPEFYDLIDKASGFEAILRKLEAGEWHFYDREYNNAVIDLYNSELVFKLHELLANQKESTTSESGSEAKR